jgi:hypothetical protein
MLFPSDEPREKTMHLPDRNLLDPLFSVFAAWRLRRRRSLTERMLREMPAGMRKDLGWPDPRRTGHPRR